MSLIELDKEILPANIAFDIVESCVVYDAPNVIDWPSIMIELLDNFELVTDPLFIWMLKVFVVGVYVKLKSAPFDIVVNNPINDPEKVAAPTCVNCPKFLSDVPTVKSSEAETLV